MYLQSINVYKYHKTSAGDQSREQNVAMLSITRITLNAKTIHK